MEVNIEETQKLRLSLTPDLKSSSKTHRIIFFESIENDSDMESQESSSSPSREEAEILQSSTSAKKRY